MHLKHVIKNTLCSTVNPTRQHEEFRSDFGWLEKFSHILNPACESSSVLPASFTCPVAVHSILLSSGQSLQIPCHTVNDNKSPARLAAYAGHELACSVCPTPSSARVIKGIEAVQEEVMFGHSHLYRGRVIPGERPHPPGVLLMHQ